MSKQMTAPFNPGDRVTAPRNNLLGVMRVRNCFSIPALDGTVFYKCICLGDGTRFEGSADDICAADASLAKSRGET